MTRRCTGIPEFKLRLDRNKCIPSSEYTVIRPEIAVNLMRKLAVKDAQESFVALFIDPTNAILGVKRISLGGLDSTSVDPRVLFSAALLVGATALIIGHNHPSGSVTPSDADDQLTQQLINGSKLLSIRLLDHIIFAPNDYFSYVAHGRLKFS